MIEKDKEELSQSIPRWIKMMEVLEKGSDANRNELSKLLTELVNGSKNRSGLEISRVFPSKEGVVMSPSEPISFKFLYEKRMTKYKSIWN
jgi:hypothetical protein